MGLKPRCCGTVHERRVDCIRKRHLRLLQGVPIALTIGCCLPFVSAAARCQCAYMQCIAEADGPVSFAHLTVLQPPVVDFAFEERPGPMDVTLDARGRLQLPRGRVRRRTPPMRFAAEVLRYQQSSAFTMHHTDAGFGVEELSAEVLTQLDPAATAEKLVTVSPQPHTDRPVFLAVPQRADVVFLVPICLQVEVRGARPAFWLDYVASHCAFSEVRDLAGDRWSPSMILYAGASDTPLFHDDSFTARPGMLLRLCFSGRAPRRHLSLAEKMCSPNDAFADIEEEGLPEAFALAGSTCVLQPLAEPVLLTVPGRPQSHALRDVMRQVPVTSADVRICIPLRPVRDTSIRSEGAERVIGLEPCDLQGLVGVFVDARQMDARQMAVPF